MSNWPVALVSSNINVHLISTSAQDILAIVAVALQRLQSRSPSAAETEQPCYFLQLPPEMRLAIYEAALLDHSDSDESSYSTDEDEDLSLLQMCRQVNMEAQPVLYQRPKSFTSQAKLFSWIGRSQRSNLERVRTLKLQLTDVNLSGLLLQQTSSRRKHTTAWSLYQAELEKLEEALRSMLNLSSLTIIPPKESGSMLLKGFYRAFLASIPSRCPKLRKLELHDNEEVLKDVPTLNEIRDVNFTKSTPRDEPSRSSEQSQEERQGPSTGPSSKVIVDEVEKRRASAPPATPSTRRRTRTSRNTDQTKV